MTSLAHYIKAFTQLRAASSQGEKAPHKPILLLSVMDAIEAGEISDNKIFITPELVARFKSNWSLLVITHIFNPNFSLPFYHLKNEKSGFWQLHANYGYEKALSSSIGSLGVLTKIVAYAELKQDLFMLLLDEKQRHELRHALLSTYFVDVSKDKYRTGKLSYNTYLDNIENKIKERPSSYIIEPQEIDEEETFVRGGTFKKIVPRIYNYTCCVSGLKITALFDAQFVDACHIVPFRKSGNDTVSNGISLSPNLHRAFDRGLFAVDEDYRVVVSNVFSETGNAGYGLKQFHGRQIFLPEDELFYPDVRNFRWHWENVFRAS